MQARLEVVSKFGVDGFDEVHGGEESRMHLTTWVLRVAMEQKGDSLKKPARR